MSKLTTHALDTAQGKPCKGLRIHLLDSQGTLLADTVTNEDGRCLAPLLVEGQMQVGRYTLRFHVADYFHTQGIRLPEPAFLDVIDIAFGIADAGQNYHVPLLVSPWSYSTYRGS
jgi:5-hydroxyisourate hydrolase